MLINCELKNNIHIIVSMRNNIRIRIRIFTILLGVLNSHWEFYILNF